MNRNLHIFTWRWGDKYPKDYFDKLAASLRRNLKRQHEFKIVTPEDCDKHLTEIPGCFARLRMFDYEWQIKQGIKPGDHIVQLDVDTVIVGQIDNLLNRKQDFIIMQGGNVQPCPYNGALWKQRSYTNGNVWTEFSLEAAAKAPYHEFPDDQGWLWHKLPNAPAWKCGDEVFVYQKPGWPVGDALPDRARLVTFAGKRRPDQIEHLDWMRKHWTL